MLIYNEQPIDGKPGLKRVGFSLWTIRPARGMADVTPPDVTRRIDYRARAKTLFCDYFPALFGNQRDAIEDSLAHV